MTNSELLRKAKEVLVTGGWCTRYVKNSKGQHCALGAVYTAFDEVNGLFERPPVPALPILEQAIPIHVGISVVANETEWRIANYNNAQTEVAPILAWFDHAIELAEAQEMYQELAKPAATGAEPVKEEELVLA